MWRHRAGCKHCGLASAWNGNRQVSEAEILTHLKDHHQIGAPVEAVDYRLEAQLQCDSCLESSVDQCTKCGRDFCRLHTGDIDGLCGGCI
ncbi:MAG: hypothetical protein WC443_04685 [Desulfobaccales bacterium]